MKNATNEAIPEFESASLDKYTDEELLHYIHMSPRLLTTRQEAIAVLSAELVAKPVGMNADVDHLDEVVALQTAHKLGINVPVLRRIVQSRQDISYLIMDRIHGFTLEQVWRDMTLWGTILVALQLRGFLRTMASVTSQTTGGLHSGRVRSIWIEAIYGPIPHASPAAFTGYLNWWLTQNRGQRRPELILRPAANHIFVHQDLAPRNMIVDSGKKLWIVDWGYAGYYPPYLEYYGLEPTEMSWLYGRSLVAWWGRIRWSIFRWIAWGRKGSDDKVHSALAVVHQRSLLYRLDKADFCQM